MVKREGIIPENLKIARIEKGLTMASLAEKIDVTRAAISLYEKGEASPSAEKLHLICEYLDKPKSFFYEERNRNYTQNSSTFFRKLTTATVTKRNASKCKADIFNDIINSILDYIQLPSVNLPFYEEGDILELDEDDLEAIAENTRSFFGLSNGPIKNIVNLLENNGIICLNIDLPSKVDAFSYSVAFIQEETSRPLMILSDSYNYFRHRFDQAHELGHLILHRDIDENEFEKHHKLIEDQAMYFAGAFLMPLRSFVKDVRYVTINNLLTLKRKWGVSMQAILYRLRQIGVIDEKRYRYLNIEISRRGWKKKEPLDSDYETEQPSMINSAITFLNENSLFDLNRFEDDLNLHLDDLYKYTQNELFINKNEGRIIEFKFRDNDTV